MIYCSNCGEKLIEDSKFCPKCGSGIDAALSKKPSSRFSKSKLTGFVLATTIAGFALVFAVEKNEKDLQIPIAVAFIILASFLGIWIIASIFKSLFKFSKSSFISFKNLFRLFLKHPIIGTLILAIFAILIFALNQFVSDYEYKQINKSLGVVQDSAAEAALAKSEKDGSAAKKVSDNLSKADPPRRLKNYTLSLKTWTDKIARSENPADEPDPFSLSLTMDQAQDAFRASLAYITGLKTFGDDAIKRGDKQTMRYVAAKLLIQKHWLDGIANSQDPGFLSLSPGTVYALEGKRRNPCIAGGKVCLADAGRLVQGVYRSALGYGIGETGSNKDWADNWGKAAPITEASDQSSSESTAPVQSFLDECKNKGGFIGGVTKERLPTTEDGRTCRYQDSKCWDFLTYSGGRYKGGANGCEEQGLLPKPKPTPTPKPDTKQNQGQDQQIIEPPVTTSSWDGTYGVDADVECDLPSVVDIKQFPGLDHIAVSNNAITSQGGTFPIDSAGGAQASMNLSYGGATVQATQNYHFYRSNGENMVNGNFQMTGSSGAGNVSFTFSCQGTFSGKQD